jgi:hypothetical protein
MEQTNLIGPLTQQEFDELKDVLAQTTSHLNPNHTRLIWTLYTRVIATPQPEPCTCKGSAGLWVTAVDTLRRFVAENDK